MIIGTPPIERAIGGLGPAELVIILVIVLLIFGAGKLPQIGDALGKSMNAFKKASTGADDDTLDVTPEAPAKPATQPAKAVEDTTQAVPGEASQAASGEELEVDVQVEVER